MGEGNDEARRPLDYSGSFASSTSTSDGEDDRAVGRPSGRQLALVRVCGRTREADKHPSKHVSATPSS